MKRFLPLLLGVILSAASMWPQNGWAQDEPNTQWFDSKYSMFIHFGLYSELGGVWDGVPVTQGYSEQIQSHGGIFSDYYARVAERFDPVYFNAKEIAALAKAAGMRSIVFTSKHHDGFCLFNTATTKYNSYYATPSHRDFVAELAQACAQEGLGFGLYYSLIDWNYPQAYPISSSNADPITPQHHAFSLAQVTELLTHYGPITELWFDMGSLTPAQSHELYDLVHRLQPHCMVSGRLGNDRYDFCVMGDNQYPSGALTTPWQTPASMFNETWGYRSWQERGSATEKAKEKLHSLLGVVAHGGNFLLNIGPKGDGKVVDFEREVLLQIGAWLAENGEAVYSSQPFELPLQPIEGYVTQKGKEIFLIVSGGTPGVVEIPNAGAALQRVEVLGRPTVLRTEEGHGRCRVWVPQELCAQAFPVVIKLSFSRALPAPTPPALHLTGAKGKVLTTAQAIPSQSYSCFDYYSNYPSVVAYNWYVTGRNARKITLEYPIEYKDRQVLLEVDGRVYPAHLSKGTSKRLPESAWKGLQWDDPQRVATRRTLFGAPIPAPYLRPQRGTGETPQENALGAPLWLPAPAHDTLTHVGAGTVYIARRVVAPAACEVVLQVGAGNGIEVCVNGQSVLKHLNPYGCEFRQETLRVNLQPGENWITLAAYHRFSDTFAYVLAPAAEAEQVVYTLPLDLETPLRASQTHTLTLTPAAPVSAHTDIEFSNLRLLF